MAWLTREQALALLGTKPQSLYASVSRGRVRARPDPADPRRSLYAGDDVARLARRGAGRRQTSAIASGAIRWGDPVLDSAITTIAMRTVSAAMRTRRRISGAASRLPPASMSRWSSRNSSSAYGPIRWR